MASDLNLDNLTIAAPCHANWNDMSGDERTRFCKLCKKHVYNISDMNRTDAVALIKKKEGNLCIRMFKRADGTVIVDNCPVGLRAIRNRVRWFGAGVAAFAAAVITLLGVFANAGVSSASAQRPATLKEWFFPPKAPQKECFMGAFAAPPPSPPAAKAPIASE